MPSVTTSPWQAAVDRIDGKTVVGSKLRSADWAQVPLALRERAFFSAGVENARVLSAMREKVLQGLNQTRTDGTLMNGSRFVADMRNLLGAETGDSGSLTDLTSVRRLKLIWDFQDQDAHAQAAHQASMDPDVQDAYPALRLVRIESRRVPRHWFTLWAAAGASVNWQGASRTEMVALVTSPIWAALSRFRRPWPPFDYGSGMGLEAVDRDETEALGLLPKGEDPAARRQRLGESIADASRDWNAGLQASVKNLGPEARGWLQGAFGDQLSIEGDTATWRDAAPTGQIVAPTPAPAPGPATSVSPVPRAPVSDALTNSTRGELAGAIDTALGAVDRVHDDGRLPAIPVRRLESGSALGVYQWTYAGAPARIAIRDEPGAWPALTTAHEIGHFLDHQVLGTRGTFASISDPLLSGFRTVADASESVRRIREIMPDGSYYLDPREIWARAYAQYIATRSGDPQLLEQLDRTRRGPQSWRQWTDEDFAPIGAAIDDIMRSKGWLK